MSDQYNGPERRRNSMTPDRIRELAREEFIDEMQKAGLDLSTQEGRDRFRASFFWVEEQRLRCEKMTGGLLLILAGGVLSALGVWLWDGLLHAINKGPSQ